MTDDEKVILMSFFPFGSRSTFEVGGDYAASVLTPRALTALEGLVAAALVTVDNPFNDTARQRFTGTDGAPRFALAGIDADWLVITPNPSRKIRQPRKEPKG